MELFRKLAYYLISFDSILFIQLQDKYTIQYKQSMVFPSCFKVLVIILTAKARRLAVICNNRALMEGAEDDVSGIMKLIAYGIMGINMYQTNIHIIKKITS